MTNDLIPSIGDGMGGGGKCRKPCFKSNGKTVSEGEASSLLYLQVLMN